MIIQILQSAPKSPRILGFELLNMIDIGFKLTNSYLHTLLDTQLQKIMGGSGRVIQGKVPSCREFKQQENVIK